MNNFIYVDRFLRWTKIKISITAILLWEKERNIIKIKNKKYLILLL